MDFTGENRMAPIRGSAYGRGSALFPFSPIPFPTQNVLTTTDYNYSFGQLAYQETIQEVAFHAGSGNWIPLGGGASYIKTINSISPNTSGNFTLTAGAGITLTPGTNAITISLGGGGTAIDSLIPDSGTSPVVPTGAGAVTMAGSGSITTVGGTNTVTTQLTGLTAHAVLVGAGTSTITKVGPSSDIGAPLISDGASADPRFSTTFTVVDASFQALLQGTVAGGAPQISIYNSSSAANSYARYTLKTDSATGDMYTNYDAPGGLTNDFQVGYQASSTSYVIQRAPASTTGNMSGTSVMAISATTGNVTFAADDVANVLSGTGINVDLAVVNTEAANSGSSARIAAGTAGSSAGDPYVQLAISGAATNKFGLDNNASDVFAYNVGANAGTAGLDGTTVFQITQAGEITKPLQPAFLAYLAATATNKTGNGTTYTLGTDALTEIYDQASNFNTNGTFTAPVTGKYLLGAQITITGTTVATSFVISIVTTARTYTSTFSRAALGADQTVQIQSLADMSATNTATITIVAAGEAADTDDIKGGATLETYFYGNLVC